MKIHIKEPIEKPIRTSQYKMELVCSSGDADHSEHNVYYYKISDSPNDQYLYLIQDLELLVSIFKLSHASSDSKLVEKTIRELGEKLNIEDPDDMYMNLVGFDVTSDGQFLASPDELSLTFFDAKGIEHECSIEIEGKTFDSISIYTNFN